MTDYLYTVPEVAKILKINKKKVYDLVRKGHLVGLKLGRIKVTRSALLVFLKAYNGKDLSDLDNVKDLTLM